MLAMEWVLGSSTSLLCLHGAPFRPRGLGSVVSVVLLRRCRDTYEYWYAWLFCSVLLALLANTAFFVPANRRRTQERPKPRRLHRSEAQLSRLHFPPSRLNYCIKMPIEVGALPLSTQLFINNEFVDAKSGTKVRAATATRTPAQCLLRACRPTHHCSV